jgi:hypothetical protein
MTSFIENERAPMPIIVGAPRSGTTLLRFMLDAHPDLAIPPETGFLTVGPTLKGSGDKLRRRFFESVTQFEPTTPAWPDFEISADLFWQALNEISPFDVSEGFRAFYRLYAARFGKQRYGDKTPIYSLNIDTIRALLPEARFVHIVRDGRDVALSLRQMWFSPSQDFEALASYWGDFVQGARHAGMGRSDYFEVRYEDLIQNTEATLSLVCERLKLSFDPAMLSYYTRTPERLKEHKGRSGSRGVPQLTQAQRWRQQWRTTEAPNVSRVFAWKREMPVEERMKFQRVAGSLLQELGYEV